MVVWDKETGFMVVRCAREFINEVKTSLIFLKAISLSPVSVTLLKTFSSEKHALEFLPSSQTVPI